MGYCKIIGYFHQNNRCATVAFQQQEGILYYIYVVSEDEGASIFNDVNGLAALVCRESS